MRAEPALEERLSRIESITDAALTQLGVDDLLNELLARVRDLLGVDTAAVLLHDPATHELVATAAKGIEKEVRQGVRVPMGAGFAGRIGVDRRPVVIPDIERAEIWNPILRETGIRSLLGVPLESDGELVGVLHVGSRAVRSFDDHDIDLLERVAERAALAIRLRRSTLEQEAATALQRSLIPGRLPSVFGLEVVGRYLPGGEGGVGGDWYDMFPLPTGAVGFAIGDVVGRGLGAAVVMGRIRSALRAYALDVGDPAEVLNRLDRKVQHFEAGQMSTAIYGVIDKALDSVRLSVAGHLPPVLVLPDGTRQPLEVVVDPPIGLNPGIDRRATTAALPQGALLAFFTDGLVERRGEPLDARLTTLTEAFVAGSAERSCVAAVGAMIADSPPTDDVALLVIRREDAGDPLHLRLPAVPRSLTAIRAAFRRWLPLVGVDEQRSIDVLLAVGEVSANVVEHAYGPGGGDVVVDAAMEGPRRLVVTVCDTGRWRASRGSNRGRGLGIIERCASETSITRSDEATVVRMVFDPGAEARQ